jgi:trans-aconitate methyltransferase
MSTAQLPEQKPYFDELAELFHIFAADTDGIYRGWLSGVVSDRSDRPGSRAADLGCGSGRFTDLLADRYNHVLAVDIAEREIELAKAEHGRPQVRFDRRSLLDVTPETDGRFDLVFTVNTVHHLRAHHIVLPHLLSLVAPGGEVVVVDIIDPGQWRSLDWHIAEAFRDAEESYRVRSRRSDVAADVLRLRLHPTWLEHVTTNIPLRRDEFHRRYSAIFPGARFAELHKEVAGMSWHAPQ